MWNIKKSIWDVLDAVQKCYSILKKLNVVHPLAWTFAVKHFNTVDSAQLEPKHFFPYKLLVLISEISGKIKKNVVL